MVHGLMHVSATKIAALLVFFAVFAPIEKLFAKRQQRLLRRGWRADTVYFLLNSVFASAGTAIAIIGVGLWLRALIPHDLHHAITHQPVAIQFVEALALSELGAYWAHRLMHTNGWLWRFHKVHHSVSEMDWLASARLHPVDRAFTCAAAYVPLFVFQFSKPTLAVYSLFAALMALGVHANVRFTFGPLRYALATPQYHHWHHAGSEVTNKNFAVQLPLMDWLFGTMHVPAGQWPIDYGIEESVPSTYLGQLAWPFIGDKAAAATSTTPS
jgi:sterol desaturase/sphingolipid hydroxylase (fatty acid hydroxylase superfamily)